MITRAKKKHQQECTGTHGCLLLPHSTAAAKQHCHKPGPSTHYSLLHCPAALLQPQMSHYCQNLIQMTVLLGVTSHPLTLNNHVMPEMGGLLKETNYCGLFGQSQCLRKQG